jgi:hypothetical protein
MRAAGGADTPRRLDGRRPVLRRQRLVGTTMAAIAAEAGVAVETIYSGLARSSFGAMDVATSVTPSPSRWPIVPSGRAGRHHRERIRAAHLQSGTHERSAATGWHCATRRERRRSRPWCADVETTRCRAGPVAHHDGRP